MTPPCKDCPQRQLGCHDRCESYGKYRKSREEARERALAAHEMNHIERERFDKLRKRRHL